MPLAPAPDTFPGGRGPLVRGIEFGDGAPIPDGGSGPLVRGASGIDADAGIPMLWVERLPIRMGGNGPLVEGVICTRFVWPGGRGPLVTLDALFGLLGVRRSGGSGWTGAFERGSAEVARPFTTTGFT